MQWLTAHLRVQRHRDGERKLLKVSGAGATSCWPADHRATALKYRNLRGRKTAAWRWKTSLAAKETLRFILFVRQIHSDRQQVDWQTQNPASFICFGRADVIPHLAKDRKLLLQRIGMKNSSAPPSGWFTSAEPGSRISISRMPLAVTGQASRAPPKWKGDQLKNPHLLWWLWFWFPSPIMYWSSTAKVSSSLGNSTHKGLQHRNKTS